MSRHQRMLAATIAIVLLAGTCVLIFGPARGARNDIGQLRTDLGASRVGIFRTLNVGRAALATTETQLQITERSLAMQRQGLRVARNSEVLAHTTTANTTALLNQTTSTLRIVRRVVTALGPLQELHGDITSVVASVQTGVRLARTTLAIAQETLSTGKAALGVALTTLRTLRTSRDLQRQLLVVARRTLTQTRQLNHKIP